jgi:hypothetical protein
MGPILISVRKKQVKTEMGEKPGKLRINVR